jgi:hypothetical protein
VVGLLPLAAVSVLPGPVLGRLPELSRRLRWLHENRPGCADVVGARTTPDGRSLRLLSMVDLDQLVRILQRMLSPAEFLSEYGLRSLSRAHDAEPFRVHLAGSEFTVRYEPGESQTALFGGNSNWRGPVWLPLNYLLIDALRRYGEYYGDNLRVAFPADGASDRCGLGEVADQLSERLIGIFTGDAAGRRAVFGGEELFHRDPRWRDLIPFYEYFHAEDGTGLGASHQTGWTSLVVDLILDVHGRPAPSGGISSTDG